jgi:YNFM family putative membrane transporter
MNNTTTIATKNLALITFLLFWTAIVVLSSLYITIPLLSVFSTSFNVSAGQAAWAGSIFSIFFSAGCLFFGAISDRYGKKNVMVIGLLCLSIITFCVGLADSFSWLLIMRALQGAAAATFSPVALTYIGIMYPPVKRVTTIGIISSGFLIAGIIGQLFSSFIVSIMDWNTVFFYLSILYMITTALFFFILPKDQITQENKNIFAIVKKFKIPFQHKPLILCNCIAIIVLLSFVGMYTALGHYLSTAYGFNDQEIFYVRAAGIFGILLSPFTGKFAQRFDIKKVLSSGFIFAILGLLIIGLSSNQYLVIAMSIVFVAGVALIVPSMLALVGQFGGKEKGIATSIYTFILFIGASIGPLLAAYILSTGYPKLPFIIFACLLGIGLLITVMIFSYEKKSMTYETHSSTI